VTASIDANILLRAIMKDVPEQSKVATRLMGDLGRPVTVADQALIETAFALENHYQIDRANCASLIEELLDLPTISDEHTVFQAAANFWASHPKLSLADCYLAETAVANQATPLWTFDHKLANQHPAAQIPALMA